MDKKEIAERKEAGRRAAEVASEGGEITVEEKPYGQTSAKVYPYTYWYVKGWNDFVKAQSVS